MSKLTRGIATTAALWLGIDLVANAAPPPPEPPPVPPAISVAGRVPSKTGPPTTIDAALDGVVELSADVEVSIIGWKERRVELASNLPSPWKVELEGDGKRTRVRVIGPPVPPGFGTVTLRVPERSDVHIATRTGDIELAKHQGAAILETLSGDIEVRDQPRALELTSTSGNIEIAGVRERLRAGSVSGNVVVTNASGRADIETISGRIVVNSAGMTRLRASTVSGNVECGGKLAGEGPYDIETNSGNVDIRIPPSAALLVIVDTFSGNITNALTKDEPDRRHFELQLGKGGPKLRIGTFSGNVKLRPRNDG